VFGARVGGRCQPPSDARLLATGRTLTIRRAIPYNAPRSLAGNEVYALTAYILSLNKLIGDNNAMDAETLPQVKMPNRDNWIMPYPDRI
jgi:S-disulfanyl-L-cysteine oxidoreductase SoxD